MAIVDGKQGVAVEYSDGVFFAVLQSVNDGSTRPEGNFLNGITQAKTAVFRAEVLFHFFVHIARGKDDVLIAALHQASK